LPRRSYVRIPKFSVHDLYEASELEDLVMTARDRVLNAFDRATEVYRGKRRGTDNYIGGIGSRQLDLTTYVVTGHMKPFVEIRSLPVLPSQFFEMNDKQLEELVMQIHTQIVQLAINTLHDERLIWYDECGLWTVCQSALDAWRQGNRTVHRRLKVDRRNYHGKPREQSKRRGIPAGAANSVYATNLS
jgi:hypothetical protein